MKREPLILDIKGNSLDDGPGIRTVIFFKGCPLSCVWCQNPESKEVGVEISFDEKECIGCDTCMETCSHGALSRDNPFFIDRERCSLCFDCVDNCPAMALTVVGREMSYDEILKAVLKDKPFYDTSGGGVTLSGGEPTMFMDFTAGLLGKLKSRGIHTLLETCGLFNLKRFHEALYPHLDTIYYDLKLHDPDEHVSFCGVRNDTIIENFIALHTMSAEGGIPVLARVPLIPGITDRESNLGALANFLRTQGVKKVQVLSYNPLWHEKSSKIGVENPLSLQEPMTRWIDAEGLERSKDIFRKENIEVV
ncbi:MAG: glycyl-radical enzyme activating protein [Deltaproteobacteria bacterium]|nr:glycyl-radical enzyme activating protein [Deltaproteobacteria bacterium]